MSVESDLKSDESLRLTAYDDATGKPLVPGYTLIGHPTIGWGIALDTGGITAEEAEYLFDNRLRRAIAEAARYPWFSRLTEARQNVIVEMHFQLGPGGFAEFRKVIAAIDRGDFEKASREMLDSKWGRQFPARTGRLAGLMKSGERNAHG